MRNATLTPGEAQVNLQSNLIKHRKPERHKELKDNASAANVSRSARAWILGSMISRKIPAVNIDEHAVGNGDGWL